MYYFFLNVSRLVNQLIEDEQIKIVKCMGFISYFFLGVYDGSFKKGKEYVYLVKKNNVYFRDQFNILSVIL